MVSPIPEKNQGRKRSSGSPNGTGGFFSRLFSPARFCCCRECTQKCRRKACTPSREEAQERTAPLGNASKNCMD